MRYNSNIYHHCQENDNTCIRVEKCRVCYYKSLLGKDPPDDQEPKPKAARGSGGSGRPSEGVRAEVQGGQERHRGSGSQVFILTNTETKTNKTRYSY